MMKQILQSFTNKKFRYGAFSALMVVIVIAILMVINLVAGQLNLNYDLTPDKLYSLTDTTQEVLDSLDQDITLYPLFKTGQENDLYKELIEKYSSGSRYVHVEYKDPYLYPQFVQSYAKEGEEIPVNSIIVESSKRSKVIKAADLVSTEFDYETYQSNITSIDIEPQITNAINYVLQESTASIYVVSNHDEPSLPSDLVKQINMANYDVNDLDLLMVSEIPEDCDVLLVSTPAQDWTAEEARAVSDYLENDGRALFMIDYTFTKYENLEGVLEIYGIGLGDYLVVEGSASNYLQNNPLWLLPNIASHDITKDISGKNSRIFFPCENRGVRGIEKLALIRNSTKVEPLLTTSKDAYGKSDPEALSVNKEPGDIDGPFDVGVAVTDTIYTNVNHETKLIVVGSTYLMDSRIGGSNYQLLLSSLSWLKDAGNNIYIKPKTGTSSVLEIDQQQALYIIVFSLLVLPIAILGMGIFVWLRRRHS